MNEAGCGGPYTRDAQLVALDAKNGFVTSEAAEHLYGVAVHPEDFRVAEQRTAALRAVHPQTAPG